MQRDPPQEREIDLIIHLTLHVGGNRRAVPRRDSREDPPKVIIPDRVRTGVATEALPESGDFVWSQELAPARLTLPARTASGSHLPRCIPAISPVHRAASPFMPRSEKIWTASRPAPSTWSRSIERASGPSPETHPESVIPR